MYLTARLMWNRSERSFEARAWKCRGPEGAGESTQGNKISLTECTIYFASFDYFHAFSSNISCWKNTKRKRRQSLIPSKHYNSSRFVLIICLVSEVFFFSSLTLHKLYSFPPPGNDFTLQSHATFSRVLCVVYPS